MEKEVKYRYGIELECIVPYEGYENLIASQDYENNRRSPFSFGTDGSVRNEEKGFSHEIRGIKPFTYEKLIPAIIELSSSCEKAKVFVNASCGFHLHISNEDFFNPTYLKRIVMTWVAIEDMLVATQPASRMNNMYCQRFLAQYLDNKYNNFRFAKAKQKLIGDLSYSHRRQALNLASLAKHGTIEIRLHAGTTNAEKIINWTRLMTALFDYAIKSYNGKKMKELFKKEISEEKIEMVFKELQLPQDLADFYSTRIEKHLFKSLAAHNKAALSNLNLLLRYRRQQKKVSELQKLIPPRTVRSDGVFYPINPYYTPTEQEIKFNDEIKKLDLLSNKWRQLRDKTLRSEVMR